MAGKSHDLTARVILQGQVDNTFTQIGAQLQNLGTQLLRTNRQIIDFGKESLQTYEDYEKSLLEVRAVWEQNYTDMSQMESDYQKVQSRTIQLARSSRFTTEDVAAAYAIAAHAGLEFEDADSLVAASIELAKAGGMDLAEAVSYMSDIVHASGGEFVDTADMIDKLVFASNLANTDVGEMAEALVRVGPSLSLFGGDIGDAVSMLAILADNGMKGTQAGTMLRSALLRLVAPTGSAESAIEALGGSVEDFTDEELAEMNEGLEEYDAEVAELGLDSEEARKKLEEYGFSAYDDNGKLKDQVTIWTDLAAAMSGMTEEDYNKTLKTIFPLRTWSTANGILQNSNDLLAINEAVMTRSKGAAAEMGDTMESGFYGLEMRVEAAKNALETLVGETLAEDLTPWMEGLKGAFDWLIDMDPGTRDSIIKFFEVITGAGGALVGAGIGMKLIGSAIGTIAGGPYLAVAIGISALTAAVGTFAESVRENKLGDMALSVDSFTETFTTLAGAFDGKYVDISLYNDEIDRLIGVYTTASQTFTQGLWDMLINGSGMSEEEWAASQKKTIDAMETMISADEDAIEQAYNMASNLAEVHAADDDTGLWASIQSYIDAGYENIMADVKTKGAAVRKAVLSAWEDGELTAEEVAYIQSTLDDYNATLENYAAMGRKGALALALHNNQTISADSLNALYEAAAAERDASISALDTRWENAIGKAMMGGATYNSPEIQAMLAEYDKEVLGTKVDMGEQMLDIFKTAMLTSDFNTQGAADLGWMASSSDVQLFKYIAEFIDQVGLDTLTEMAKYNKDAANILSGYNHWTFEGSKAGEDAGSLFGFDMFGWTGNVVDFFFGGEEPQAEIDFIPGTEYIDNYIESLQNKPIQIQLVPTGGLGGVDAPKLEKKALGGRADEAAIFGEAGPEWAIPEEHTSRTAELLRMAAAASGFTWGELLSARGGLNAGGGGPVTVVYSPTINANDVSGVREELIADKGRLEKWLREREMKEELVSYA